MKKYILSVFTAILLISLLCGCNNVDQKAENDEHEENESALTGQITEATETQSTETNESTETSKSTETNESTEAIEASDENKDDQSVSLTLNSPNEINLLPLYLDGLKSNDPEIRWYSCYKMIGYYNTDHRNEITEALKVLLNDSNDSVKQSAEFVLSLYGKSFEAEAYSKSPNGKYIAFYCFGETRFNDGICHIYNAEEDCIYSFDNSYTSINGFDWSPDGNILCVSHGGRTWIDISFIDVKNNRTYTPGVQIYINENQKELGYVTGDWGRPDPTTGLIEWSLDLKKVLLSYTFIDDDKVGQKGLCIYDLEQEKIERIVKLGKFDEDHPSIDKPDDFKW